MAFWFDLQLDDEEELATTPYAPPPPTYNPRCPRGFCLKRKPSRWGSRNLHRTTDREKTPSPRRVAETSQISTLPHRVLTQQHAGTAPRGRRGSRRCSTLKRSRWRRAACCPWWPSTIRTVSPSRWVAAEGSAHLYVWRIDCAGWACRVHTSSRVPYPWGAAICRNAAPLTPPLRPDIGIHQEDRSMPPEGHGSTPRGRGVAGVSNTCHQLSVYADWSARLLFRCRWTTRRSIGWRRARACHCTTRCGTLRCSAWRR
jgi:hypothetical protein